MLSHVLFEPGFSMIPRCNSTPWCAESAVGNTVKMLGRADGALMDCSDAGICIFLTWFFLSWKQELSDVAIIMERKLRVSWHLIR